MKITIKKAELTAQLAKLVPFVERKTTIPILTNLLVVASDTGVTFSATNLEQSLRTHLLDVNVHSAGACTIPARKLSDCVKRLKTIDADDVTIESLADEYIRITCGPLAVKLAGMEAKNFPCLPYFPAKSEAKLTIEQLRANQKGAQFISVDAANLRGLIDRATFAICNEESRYTLNGGLLVFKDSTMTLVTTDGHRLAHVSVLDNFRVPQEATVLVPRPALEHLAALLDCGLLEISKSEETLFFRAGNWTMITRILTGQFPNYRAVMPLLTDRAVTASFSISDLRASLERIIAFADDRSHAVRFRLQAEGVRISAKCSETGEASELIPADVIGTSVTGFNGLYVLDILKTQTKDARIMLRVKDNQCSAVFTPERESEGFDSFFVLMPMRIDAEETATETPTPVPVEAPKDATVPVVIPEDDDAILAA